MIVHKIDVTTGNFIEDCQFENRPILEDGNFDPQYVEEVPPQGFYLPRWNGTEWVEDGQAPGPVEPETQAPTMEQMAIALMQTQLELETTTEALDFLIMGGI